MQDALCQQQAPDLWWTQRSFAVPVDASGRALGIAKSKRHLECRSIFLCGSDLLVFVFCPSLFSCTIQLGFALCVIFRGLFLGFRLELDLFGFFQRLQRLLERLIECLQRGFICFELGFGFRLVLCSIIFGLCLSLGFVFGLILGLEQRLAFVFRCAIPLCLCHAMGLCRMCQRDQPASAQRCRNDLEHDDDPVLPGILSQQEHAPRRSRVRPGVLLRCRPPVLQRHRFRRLQHALCR